MIDPEKSLRFIAETAPKYAQAKANRIYLDEYRKSLKSLLMIESGQATSAAQETAAYASSKYIAHLEALKVAVEEEEVLRWKLVAAEAAIETWRSQEASNRSIDKSAR